MAQPIISTINKTAKSIKQQLFGAWVDINHAIAYVWRIPSKRDDSPWLERKCRLASSNRHTVSNIYISHSNMRMFSAVPLYVLFRKIIRHHLSRNRCYQHSLSRTIRHVRRTYQIHLQCFESIVSLYFPIYNNNVYTQHSNSALSAAATNERLLISCVYSNCAPLSKRWE